MSDMATHHSTDEGIVLVTLPASPEDQQLSYSIRHDETKYTVQEQHLQSESNALSKYILKHIPAHLSLPAKHLHIVISTNSGINTAEAAFEAVFKPLLRAAGLEETSYTVRKTTSSESIRTFARGTLRDNASRGVAQTVLLLSGDGGVVDLVNGMLEGLQTSSSFVRPDVVLFPFGTGNALFHSIYREAAVSGANDLVLAFRSLFHGSPRSLPIFVANFSKGSRLLSDEGRVASLIAENRLYGAVVASYGFHATLVADSDTAEYRQHGDKRFGMAARKLLAEPHAYKAAVSVGNDGTDEMVVRQLETLHQNEHAYLLATLVSNLEKTFTISPASRPLDGQLRFVHFEPMSGEQIMNIMMAAYDGGKHVADGNQMCGYDVIDRLKIDFLETDDDSTWRRVCIDGLIVKIERGGFMSIETVPSKERAINIVAPVSQ